jgi:hypothetical protein
MSAAAVAVVCGSATYLNTVQVPLAQLLVKHDAHALRLQPQRVATKVEALRAVRAVPGAGGRRREQELATQR